MAVYKSIASGNFSDSSTWGLVDADTYKGTISGFNVLIPTSYTTGPSFTATSITVDGILLFVVTKSGDSGTFTVELYNSTISTIEGTVTINVSDLEDRESSNMHVGWYYFKFASSVALTNGDTYNIRVKSSVANLVNLKRNSSTTNDFTSGLVTTSTGSPSANDELIIAGEFLSTSTINSFTVTMNNTSTTTYGVISVNNKATLTYGIAASTDYYLKTAATLSVYKGGVFQIGTEEDPIPSSSTASLEFACASIAEYGLEVYGGVLTTYGFSKIVNAKLDGDVAASATSITTDVSTGWKDGDEIVISGTTRTNTEFDRVTLAVDASGTTVTVPSLTYAHGGNSTTMVQADIINLTRNVKIFASNVSFPTYIYALNFASTAIDLSYTECYNFGSNVTTKRGLEWTSNGGSLSINYCSFYDATTTGAIANQFEPTNLSGTISISHNVYFNITTYALSVHFYVGTYTIDSNIVILSGIILGTVTGTFTNNVLANSNLGLLISDPGLRVISSFSGNEIYGCQSYGVSFNNTTGKFSDFKIWRNKNQGILVSITFTQIVPDKPIILENGVLFGNSNYNINFATGMFKGYLCKNLIIDGGGSLGTNIGMLLANGDGGEIISCAFGLNSTHIQGDISGGGISLNLHDCRFGSTVEFASQSNLIQKYHSLGIYNTNYQTVNGIYKSYDKCGIVQADTTIYSSVSPSMRLTPIHSTYKLNHTPLKMAVKSGESGTVSVKVRKSVVGDGTAYNGDQPRLMVRANRLGGIASDTILDTATDSANGSFITLSGATPSVTGDCVLEIYVDCNGTAGWINVDSFSSTYYTDTRQGNFIFGGQPYIEMAVAGGGERSYTFID